jgi:hypothetical protein
VLGVLWALLGLLALRNLLWHYDMGYGFCIGLLVAGTYVLGGAGFFADRPWARSVMVVLLAITAFLSIDSGLMYLFKEDRVLLYLMFAGLLFTAYTGVFMYAEAVSRSGDLQ